MRLVKGTDLGTLLAQEGPLAPERAIAIVARSLPRSTPRMRAGSSTATSSPPTSCSPRRPRLPRRLRPHPLSRRRGARTRRRTSRAASTTWPPSRSRQPPDPRADEYALGCVLYECLTGQPPFARPRRWPCSGPTSTNHLLPPEQRPELPEAIDPVIASALAKEPAERYPSCGELASAAAEALGVGLAPPRISRRRLLLLAAGGAVAVAAATGVPAILLTRGGKDDPAKPTTVITRDSMQRIDPETNKLVATIPFGQPGPSRTARRARRRRGRRLGDRPQSRNRQSNRDEHEHDVEHRRTPGPDTGLVQAMIDAGLGGIWIRRGRRRATDRSPHRAGDASRSPAL